MKDWNRLLHSPILRKEKSMRYIPSFLVFCRASVLMGLLCTALPARADTIKVGGTGSGIGVIKLLAEAYRVRHPETQIIVVPALGSSGGIRAVAAGVLDLGLSGRPLTPTERGQRLVEQEIARTPLVLATMHAHPGFTLSEVVQIYRGTLQTWPDGSPLRLILRPQTDTESTILRLISPEMDRAVTVAHARPGVHIAIVDQDSADAIERIPGAFGTSSLALILSEQRKMKALRVNGVMPSVATLADGSYPCYKALTLITGRNPSEPVKGFVEFILSRQGARMLSNHGFLPVRPGEK